MKKILKVFLKILAKQVLRRYHPIVVGVTGSVGKTTAKETIYAVLSKKFWVWKNADNFNNEFGVPDAILGINPKNFTAISRKLSAIGSAIWLAFGPRRQYPRILVLELAADRPGDIGYLVDIIRPTIGVVTAIGAVPVHVEFYSSPKHVAKEKAKLIQALMAPSGLAVLNHDDPAVLEMKQLAKVKTVTFGLMAGADLWASDINYFVTDDDSNIGGLSFKVHQGETFVPMRLNNIIAPHQIYGVLAATAVALRLGLNLLDVASGLERLELPRGRMNLLRGIHGSIIIDDSYNASPTSTQAALETLKGFSAALAKLTDQPRRVAILGDMRELGKYTEEAHRAIGKRVGECAELLITVGPAAKFIADTALPLLGPDKIMSFDTSVEAKEKMRTLVLAGDIVLVKGSHSMQMERIVEEITVK